MGCTAAPLGGQLPDMTALITVWIQHMTVGVPHCAGVPLACVVGSRHRRLSLINQVEHLLTVSQSLMVDTHDERTWMPV